jgi:hypothetical protein
VLRVLSPEAPQISPADLPRNHIAPSPTLLNTMPTHKSHGREYIEPPRHDELPEGVRAPDDMPAHAGVQNRARGQFQPDNAETTALAAKGGRSRRGATSLSHTIGQGKLSPESHRRAKTLRRALASEIAENVGGGYCGVAASLFIRFASEKTAAAEEAFARGDYDAHRKESESARMDILYAREHAAKEAASRADSLRNWVPPTPQRLPPARPSHPTTLSPELRQKAIEFGYLKEDADGDDTDEE